MEKKISVRSYHYGFWGFFTGILFVLHIPYYRSRAKDVPRRSEDLGYFFEDIRGKKNFTGTFFLKQINTLFKTYEKENEGIRFLYYVTDQIGDEGVFSYAQRISEKWNFARDNDEKNKEILILMSANEKAATILLGGGLKKYFSENSIELVTQKHLLRSYLKKRGGYYDSYYLQSGTRSAAKELLRMVKSEDYTNRIVRDINLPFYKKKYIWLLIFLCLLIIGYVVHYTRLYSNRDSDPDILEVEEWLDK